MRNESTLLCLLLTTTSLMCCERSDEPDGGRIVHEDADQPEDGDTSPTCLEPGSVPDWFICRCDADCHEGAMCFGETELGGIPGRRCFRACLRPEDCEDGYHCSTSSVVPGGYCVNECESNSDCPPASSCGSFNAGQDCMPICQDDSECESGHCDRYSGYCRETRAEGGEPGAACLRNEDCRSLLCALGNCVSWCSVERQGCPDGHICGNYEPSDVGICARICELNTQCRDLAEGTTCYRFAYPPGARGCL